MIDLEQLAKESFEKFGLRETGRKPDWKYLGDERKAEWKNEVFEIINEALLVLRGQIKPVPTLSPQNNSYSMGRNDGIKEERVNIITLMEKIHLDLQDQI
jgi:hypothetical protein